MILYGTSHYTMLVNACVTVNTCCFAPVRDVLFSVACCVVLYSVFHYQTDYWYVV